MTAIKQSLFGKKVKFWFIDRDGRYELTGVVTEHIVAENCLTVQDDKKGLKYYLGIDRIQVIQ